MAVAIVKGPQNTGGVYDDGIQPLLYAIQYGLSGLRLGLGIGPYNVRGIKLRLFIDPTALPLFL